MQILEKERKIISNACNKTYFDHLGINPVNRYTKRIQTFPTAMIS